MGYKFFIDDWVKEINSVIEYLKYKDKNGGLNMKLDQKGQPQEDDSDWWLL